MIGAAVSLPIAAFFGLVVGAVLGGSWGDNIGQRLLGDWAGLLGYGSGIVLGFMVVTFAILLFGMNLGNCIGNCIGWLLSRISRID